MSDRAAPHQLHGGKDADDLRPLVRVEASANLRSIGKKGEEVGQPHRDRISALLVIEVDEPVASLPFKVKALTNIPREISAFRHSHAILPDSWSQTRSVNHVSGLLQALLSARRSVGGQHFADFIVLRFEQFDGDAEHEATRDGDLNKIAVRTVFDLKRGPASDKLSIHLNDIAAHALTAPLRFNTGGQWSGRSTRNDDFARECAA